MAQQIQLYTTNDGQVTVEVTQNADTLWLTQAQMAELFGTKRPAITKHLGNIFKSGELDEDSTCSILEHVAEHGQAYKTKHYNLDAIISVGYRVNSTQATRFRIWATRILKQHLVEGYTLNQRRLQERGIEFEQALKLLTQTLTNQQLINTEGAAVVTVIHDYARSWSLLQAYDEQSLKTRTDKQTDMKALMQDDVLVAISQLKQELITKGEATALFGQLRGDGQAC